MSTHAFTREQHLQVVTRPSPSRSRLTHLVFGCALALCSGACSTAASEASLPDASVHSASGEHTGSKATQAARSNVARNSTSNGSKLHQADDALGDAAVDLDDLEQLRDNAVANRDASAPDLGARFAVAQAEAGAASAFDCPSVPTAYVYEYEERTEARTWLAEAGFEVQALPLDQSPWRLQGAIVLGSGVSKDPEYAAYVKAYARDLYNFVDKANVLVQLRQSAGEETDPPFLPSTHGATRSKNKTTGVRVSNPGRALVTGLPEDSARLLWPGDEMPLAGFKSQDGFEVLLQQAGSKREPVLMEGAYGQGRIVLSQVPFDRADPADDAAAGVARSFFANVLSETNNVCRRDTQALEISAGTIADVLDPDSSVIAVLPDTQVYSLRYPGLFTAQTSFLAENVENLDIKYVFQLGDITNNNTRLEWQHAYSAMSLLHGRVPYAMVPGNHDYGPSGDASNRKTRFNSYFKASDQSWHNGLGGVFEEGKLDNSYHLLSVGGHDYILIALEWGPRNEVLEWANTIMDQHPDRLGIMITHAFLNNNNRRYDHTDSEHPQDYNPHEYATPGVNDGEEIWQKLITKHPFVLTINGHVLGDGAGYKKSQTESGTTCHQILVNYQMRKLGGEAYLRLLEFPRTENALRVWSYSPLYDDFMHDDDQEFIIAPFPG